MRLFVALDLDDTARDAVVQLSKRIARRFDRSDLRWSNPDQLHLTLAFVGEASDAVAGAVQDAMRAPIDMPVYSLVLGGLGVFPPRGAPRVLWIGSIRGGRETIDLQRIVADRLAGVGVELERRPFHAHLTLGRWRESGERDRRTVVEFADTGEVARTAVDRVTLYQSRLSPHGAAHTPLVTTMLHPAGAGTD